MKLKDFLEEYNLHKDDPNYLSDLGVRMAGHLFTHNTQTAQAELEEKSELVKLLETVDILDDGKIKKTSVAEAENRAVVNTLNKYGEFKKQGEAWVEVLNMIKKRIEVLGWERKNA